MMHRILSITVLGILMLSLSACPQSNSRSSGLAVSDEEAPKVGYYAPNFRLQSLDHGEISLLSLKGKLVFISFWATWCTPCKAEMPSMEALYLDFKDKGLEILAISNDIGGARDVQPFVDSIGVTYPILLDADFRVDDRYLIRSVPTTILVDRDGIITHRIVGAMNWDSTESRNLIQKLLRVR